MPLRRSSHLSEGGEVNTLKIRGHVSKFGKGGHTPYHGGMLAISALLIFSFVSVFKIIMEMAHSFLLKCVNGQLWLEKHLIFCTCFPNYLYA